MQTPSTQSPRFGAGPGLRLVLSLSAVTTLSCATGHPDAATSTTPAAIVAGPVGAATNDAKLQAILAMPHREDADRQRDQYRHPIQTLNFFGVRDDMNVIEIWPGGGWYTKVLAPFLKEKGKLAVTNTAGGKKYADLLASSPELYGKVEVRLINPPTEIAFGPDGSADVVLTFRNVHGWVPGGYDNKVYAAAFKVLKPGGVFGVVEHRAKAGADPATLKDTGYVSEEFVIKRVQEAGFKLADKSEINANPKDTKDYPKGVWTLPPSLRLGDVDKDKYLAIGESDRMTLKFVKP
jgi:predicted methyltransferase